MTFLEGHMEELPYAIAVACIVLFLMIPNYFRIRRQDRKAAALLEDKLRRIVYQTGFFRVRRLAFRATPLPLELHVPYWLGFYDRGGTVRLRIPDTVLLRGCPLRGGAAGARARHRRPRGRLPSLARGRAPDVGGWYLRQVGAGGGNRTHDMKLGKLLLYH